MDTEGKTFSQIIKEAREGRGLTQREVAEKIQATDAYISALENNKKAPPPRPTVIALAYILGLDPEKLWEVALKEREERAIEKVRSRDSRLGRTESISAVAESLTREMDEEIAGQIKSLILEMKNDTDFLSACLNLKKAFEDKEQRGTILRTIEIFAKAAKVPEWERAAKAHGEKDIKKASEKLAGSRSHKAEDMIWLLPTFRIDPANVSQN